MVNTRAGDAKRRLKGAEKEGLWGETRARASKKRAAPIGAGQQKKTGQPNDASAPAVFPPAYLCGACCLFRFSLSLELRWSFAVSLRGSTSLCDVAVAVAASRPALS